MVFLLPIAFSYCIFYAPELIPGYDENRIALNVAADLVFISSFFVLGGDFWDKVRALFVYDRDSPFSDHIRLHPSRIRHKFASAP